MSFPGIDLGQRPSASGQAAAGAAGVPLTVTGIEDAAIAELYAYDHKKFANDFVSAWTKRAPFMVAFLPLVLIPLIEGIFFRSAHFAEAVWGRGAQLPLFQAGIDVEEFFDEESIHLSEEMVSLLAHIDLSRFFSSVDTWIGFVVCGLLTTAAIYVRRFRDES